LVTTWRRSLPALQWGRGFAAASTPPERNSIMHISAATLARPAFSLVSHKDPVPQKDSGIVGAGHRSATLDDPDLCPPWPPRPFPHHSLADMVATLTARFG